MNQMTSIKAEIAKLGAQFNPDIVAATRALYAGLIAPPSETVRADYDIAYGPHPRQTIDVYSAGGATPRPVLLFVPGGGFIGGDKRADDTFFGNLARWFATEGFVVVTMNYRLAPDHVWPAGAQDVGSALAWIKPTSAVMAAIPAIFCCSASRPARPTLRRSCITRNSSRRSPASGALCSRAGCTE